MIHGNQTPTKELLTLPEASEWLGIDHVTLRKWLDCQLLGTFQATPTSRRYVYRSEIQEKILRQPTSNGTKPQ